ncbi:MAG TPA: ABC transporter ATP-binding protein [Candidatus Dormibacteraeota bacterium]|nr:ABC transporter ATP-binding protein [Candidatus Dormibacteraeota bacterium]
MVSIQALTKRYGPFVAVDGLSLEIGRGQLFGFLGPNGAGKTTTIKMLVGLLRPTSGRAAVTGHDVVTEPEAAKAAIGYVPDSATLYDKLTAREFLEFSGDLYHLDRPTRNRRIATLLGLFELTPRADELLSAYSRGMRQKVSLAAALLHEPQVIFLDEPTVGLDPRSARLMKDILLDLCRDGRTVFVSTHILEIAERMCSHIGIINQGRLVTAGPVAEILHRDGGSESLEHVFLELTGSEAGEDIGPLLAELER